VSSDADIMSQVLRLAARGRGGVEPNPMVGCIIVKDGAIIGEGYHQKYGGPHAEPVALDSCSRSPQGATAYVNLEPCCHLDKQTPPCVPRLIDAKVARVVVGCADPNPSVNGRGLAQLRAAGIAVEDGVLGDQATQFNAAYFKQVTQRRPYVTLKWAQTVDGKIAGPGGRPLNISNAAARRIVHRLRARSDAILVGIETVLRDDPLLTARRVENPRPLLRIVVDSNLRIPPGSRLCQTTSEGPVLVCCAETAFERQPGTVAALNKSGVEVIWLPINDAGGLSLAALLEELGRRRITHLLVEPGPMLAGGFLREKLADRAWIVRAPLRVDDPSAPAAVAVDWPTTGVLDVGGDQLTEYLNPQSPVFFATELSADMVLESAV
jgi:diaminohydroxyphosphoribosylaminopyrimidine deaminase/5-amino-6-(5-phosphoribosylamino)uracil reductase